MATPAERPAGPAGSLAETSGPNEAGPPIANTLTPRRYPVGAEPVGRGRTHFRVWAPATRSVNVVLDDGRAVALDAESHGYFSGLVEAAVGSRYQFQLDSGDRPYPDPASRFQPDGPTPLPR